MLSASHCCQLSECTATSNTHPMWYLPTSGSVLQDDRRRRGSDQAIVRCAGTIRRLQSNRAVALGQHRSMVKQRGSLQCTRISQCAQPALLLKATFAAAAQTPDPRSLRRAETSLDEISLYSAKSRSDSRHLSCIPLEWNHRSMPQFQAGACGRDQPTSAVFRTYNDASPWIGSRQCAM